MIVNLTPIPILFVPSLATYIVVNYTRPYDLLSPPKILTAIHIVAVISLSMLCLIGEVSPAYAEGAEVRFRASASYYFVVGYIYFSLFAALGVITYNLFFGNYFVRLHSLYLFVGILLACVLSAIFVVFLPLFGIYLNSLAAVGMLAFLWFSWIPVTKYRLFTTELTDFGKDFRNPTLSSVIVAINRFLLNTMDPKAFKEICDQFESARSEEAFALQAEMLLESAYTKEGSISNHIRKYSKKVTNLFIA
ncbi:hypothetical protein LEP1GSC058_1623 [Leptospira fainei serovar Hurstbridge str. BUT 6]|uniref:Histidine kinase N-terminal 7TM region domain-containing protein n=1 Tax=Leptospira fainei serovar Hurstbridge str. BUT 6 TaxID=1193011 RepID=S3V0J9_9LEPT|nr:hypothetical protein LEP1GSC058_1623 [Leptospira fainei serovar Hurstbridge str. BUT 6]